MTLFSVLPLQRLSTSKSFTTDRYIVLRFNCLASSTEKGHVTTTLAAQQSRKLMIQTLSNGHTSPSSFLRIFHYFLILVGSSLWSSLFTMSQSLHFSLQDCDHHSNTNAGFNTSLEISRANQNMGHVAQILSKVILSGEMSLLDHENIVVFRSFTNNLFAINQKILQLSTNDPLYPKAPVNKPTESIEFDSDKSSLTNSVHNSDVTKDNGEAQEQSSCLWVSEFAGSSSSEDDITSHSEVNNLEDSFPRKRKSTTNDRLAINGKSQKLNAAITNEGTSNTTIDDHSKQLTSIQQIETYVLQYSSDNTHCLIDDAGESFNSKQLISESQYVLSHLTLIVSINELSVRCCIFH
jgi:hypothetical protein